MNILATVLVYKVSLIQIACLVFAVASVIAGLQPIWLESMVATWKWLSVVILATVFARNVWRHLARTSPEVS